MLSSSIASTCPALTARTARRLRRRARWALTLACVCAAAVAAWGQDPARGADAPAELPAAGTWQRMAPAPEALKGLVTASAWTGRRYIVLGQPGSEGQSVAAAYDPRSNRWRRLSSPGKTALYPGGRAIWTGARMVVMNAFTTDVYDPRSDRWAEIGRGHGGLVTWTGREVIAWGGGCCGEARRDGVAFDPATGSWRTLPRSPLAGSQSPSGAWTGTEVLLFVGDVSPDTGKPWPARLARAAAYNPQTDSWRRIARPPEQRWGASSVWDGHELLVIGGRAGPRRGMLQADGLAYDPATDRWRRLASMPFAREAAAAARAGKRLLLWGGRRAGNHLTRQALAYDPAADRWSKLPPAPIRGRPSAAAAWTGRDLIVWGGGPYDTRLLDGAVLRLATP